MFIFINYTEIQYFIFLYLIFIKNINYINSINNLLMIIHKVKFSVLMLRVELIKEKLPLSLFYIENS